MSTFDTPILLLIFNRPDHTAKVFARIREVKPRYLFVAADGPRPMRPEDAEKCLIVRELVTNGVDWECELKTLFRDKNLGCGHGPADAISWFFNEVEAGIILEDDCLASHSFFKFCEILLKEYKDDSQVLAISGFNYFGEWRKKEIDYFFSDGGNWGWASWRRAWHLFDFNMATWQTANEDTKERILQFYPDFENLYHKIVDQNYDAWDIQWHYARLYHNGFSITPSVNLVQNIGFDEQASHTKKSFSSFAKLKAIDISVSRKLKRPSEKKMDLNFRNALIALLNSREKDDSVVIPFRKILRWIWKKIE